MTREEGVRRLGYGALAALGVGLIAAPETTLRLFWSGLVPLLPAVFLVHPALWRAHCPIAGMSLGRDGEAPGRGVSTDPSPWAGAAGVLPFLLLVGWRGTGLDERPAETGALLAGLLGVAVVAGRRGVRRSGFCNRFCPLLPVERLYGQRPLAPVADSRCSSCTLCTPRGCLDLSPATAGAQLLGPRRGGPDWLLTPFGAFAAAFPGFVVAWFLATPARGDGAVLRMAGLLALGLAGSWTGVALVVRGARVPWHTALPTLAAAALAFYLFAVPRSVDAWGGPAWVALALRIAAGALVAAWWVRALRSRAGSRRRSPG